MRQKNKGIKKESRFLGSLFCYFLLFNSFYLSRADAASSSRMTVTLG